VDSRPEFLRNLDAPCNLIITLRVAGTYVRTTRIRQLSLADLLGKPSCGRVVGHCCAGLDATYPEILPEDVRPLLARGRTKKSSRRPFSSRFEAVHTDRARVAPCGRSCGSFRGSSAIYALCQSEGIRIPTAREPVGSQGGLPQASSRRQRAKICKIRTAYFGALPGTLGL